MRNRNWRRVQRALAIKRVDNWTRSNGFLSFRDESEHQHHVRKRAVNPASCSNSCCGNPRKWFGAGTIQERKWTDRCQEVFQEEGLRCPFPNKRISW